MARKARAAMADMRALEEEAERMNPVDPKKAMAGAGKRKAKMEPESDSDASECGAMLAEHVKKYHGGAYLAKFHGGMRRHLAAEAAPKMKGGINTGQFEGEGMHRVVGAGKESRGAKISRIMKSKGMSLGEASKYLKAHPDA